MYRHRLLTSTGGHRQGYEVGYGKAPLHGRFQAGQSGNPVGRIKGSRNLKTDVKRMLAMPVTVTEGGRTRKTSTQESALLVLREKALRGDQRALERLLEYAVRFNSDIAESAQAQPLTADDEAILAAYAADHAAPAKAPATNEGSDDAVSKPNTRSGKKVPKE